MLLVAVQALGTNHPGREYQDPQLLAFVEGGCCSWLVVLNTLFACLTW